MLLIDFAFIAMLRKNLYKLYMKRENGKTQLAEIKNWEVLYYKRPIRYRITVEYLGNGGKKKKTIITKSSFIKKYKNEKYIQIVTIPGTNFVFFEEENWRIQNIELIIIITSFSVCVLPLFLIGCLGILLMGGTYCITFLFILIVLILLGNKIHIPTQYRHKTRMKYITKMSGNEIIEKLEKGNCSSFIFEKEKDDIKDKLYILSINNMSPFCRRYGHEKARYRVLVTSEQEGSAVWLYLFECSNDYALDYFSERVRGFMEKKIEAFRVE